jgi:hypothetical protein
MGEAELENRLGRFKAEYRSPLGKILVNVILALIWIFVGYALVTVLWDSYESQGAAIAVGLVFLVTGLGYVIIPFYRRFGKKIRQYEEGVLISTRGTERAWRFDEIEGIRVLPSRSSTMLYRVYSGTSFNLGGILRDLVIDLIGGEIDAARWVKYLMRADIGGYEFYVEGVREFEIKPLYSQWNELGAEVFLGVLQVIVSGTVERVKRGEPVVMRGFGPDRVLSVYVADLVIKQLAEESRLHNAQASQH